jgi:ParB-like chromosome segregation protein Spo0J
MDFSDPMNWHPAANLFPLSSPEEISELAKDIGENGLINLIVLLDGKVLDGRNRLLACKEAGMEPRFVTWDHSEVSPVTWVISLNLKRRHLTPGQLAAVAVEAKVLLAADAKERQSAAGAANLNRFNRKSSSPRSGLTSTLRTKDVPQIEKAVAKQFEVSHSYVHAAQKIKDADEKVFQRLKTGTITIPEAEKELGFKQSTKAMVASDSNEWYTPDNYIKAARAVLGEIGLDPASCEMADARIKAGTYYSIENDGLKHKWKGNVWLNPPYGDLGPKFVAKAISEYEAGHLTEAILLLNSHVTDSKWFKPLFQYVLCFTDHRSRFWNAEGIGGAAHGSVFVYFGKRKDAFEKQFSQFGSIVSQYGSIVVQIRSTP